MANEGNDPEHLHLKAASLISFHVNTIYMILLAVIYIILSVFVLKSMCLWISSWPNVQLRHNYQEEKGKQINVSERNKVLQPIV